MNVAGSAFLYVAIAASGGALAFLSGQRSSGRTPPGVESVYEHAMLLDSVARDLRALTEQAEKLPAPEVGREELETARGELAAARTELEDAIGRLRRGADLVV